MGTTGKPKWKPSPVESSKIIRKVISPLAAIVGRESHIQTSEVKLGGTQRMPTLSKPPKGNLLRYWLDLPPWGCLHLDRLTVHHPDPTED